MSRSNIFVAMTAILLVASVSLAVSPSSNSFQMKKITSAVGGGECASPSYHLSALIGQTAIGRTSSAHYNIDNGFYSETAAGLSAVEELQTEVPTFFKLGTVYPNPFNPSTMISYEIPQRCHAVLKIYNVEGRLVRTLLDEERPAGRYDVIWNGQDNHGAQTASGIYLLRMKAADFSTGRKITLLK